MTKEEVLEKLLATLKEKVSLMSFNTMLKDLNIYSYKDNEIVLTINSDNELLLQTIEKNYKSTIEEILNDITNDTCIVKYEQYNKLKKEENIVKTITKIEKNSNINLEEDLNNYSYSSNFNELYTFDNFVVGESNELAYKTALAVAQNPGTLFNPYFLYAKSGLGKTHLMHAIGNHIVKNHPEMKVLYTTSDNFRNDYAGIANSKGNSIDGFTKFKNKYRNIDVLIIDDIQYLTNAQKTQEEFFHTFNELHSKGKQIIISSDSSPDDLKILEERLRSRFNWGLPVDIYPPDFDLRCRIIKDKIKHSAISSKITDEAIEFIANNFEGDVRKIESAINRLVAFTAMDVPDIIDLEFTNEALKDIVGKYNPYNTNDVVTIQKAVADYYGITVEMLKGKKRSANIAYPRMVAMYLCRMLTDQSFPRIGLEFGGRDHSTVIHAVDKIEDDLKTNHELKNIINEIKGKL